MQHAFRCDAASVTKAVVGRAAGSQIETLFLLRSGGTYRERTFLTFAVGARTSATVKRHSFPADRRSPRAIRSLKVTALPRIVVTGRSLLSMIYAISMAQGIEPGPKRADCAEGTGRAPSGTHCQSRATAHDACKHRPIAPRQRIGGCFFPVTALGFKMATDWSQPRTPRSQPATVRTPISGLGILRPGRQLPKMRRILLREKRLSAPQKSTLRADPEWVQGAVPVLFKL